MDKRIRKRLIIEYAIKVSLPLLLYLLAHIVNITYIPGLSWLGLIYMLLVTYYWYILLAVFVATLAITKYMSVASITLMSGIAIMYAILLFMGKLCFDMSVPAEKAMGIESLIIIIFIAGIAIYKHKANIIRLKNHEENRFTFKKSVKTDEDK